MAQRPEDATPAATYQRVFVPAIFDPLTEALLERARPGAGMSVLDLGTGTGVVARRLAPVLGPGGSIVAADISPGMLAVARSQVPVDGAPIAWLEADAAALPVPDASVDLVIAQQVLQYLPDRDAALQEVRRVLRPGGRFVATVWSHLEDQPLMAALTEVEARHVAALGMTFEDVAEPFLWGDPTELETTVARAGLEDVRVERVVIETSFPAATFVADVELAYASVVPSFIDDRAAFEAFVAAVEADAGPNLEPFRDGDRLRSPMTTNLVTATVPT